MIHIAPPIPSQRAVAATGQARPSQLLSSKLAKALIWGRKTPFTIAILPEVWTAFRSHGLGAIPLHWPATPAIRRRETVRSRCGGTWLCDLVHRVESRWPSARGAPAEAEALLWPRVSLPELVQVVPWEFEQETWRERGAFGTQSSSKQVTRNSCTHKQFIQNTMRKWKRTMTRPELCVSTFFEKHTFYWLERHSKDEVTED